MTSNNIKLVEYNPGYAKAVAEMWNRSDEGWNGMKHASTEESVKQKEAVSPHLNLYLALDGEKVIGYCKLSKYFADEATLYIDLLNVDPAYHGQKAGKLLVKRAVERTMELDYPRLDLFTWAGNTKAVPLYKKCGFFWEKMESGSTHLMNFIPLVVKTELTADFFNDACWYDHSNRLIEIEPDGRTENEFDFLSYSWHKNGRNLAVEFEKSGRGITKIETDDYAITVKIANNKLVFGRKHPVDYEIVNKSGKPLSVEICGLKNRNITNCAAFSGTITGSQTISAEFLVDKIDIPQSIWQTHPAVLTEITVNGKKAEFRTGINPQFPLQIKTNENNSLIHAGQVKEIFMDVENNLPEACTFEVIFPQVAGIEFITPSQSFTLQKGERNTIAVKVLLSNSVLIYQDIAIKASLSSGEVLTYTQKLRLILNTYDGRLFGCDDYNYYLNFGKFGVTVDKHLEYNEVTFTNLVSEIWGFVGMPRFGKPFSQEFQTRGAYKHEFSTTDSTILLKLYYQSTDFAGAEAVQCLELSRNGMLKQWYEIISFPIGVEEFDFCHAFNLENSAVTMHYDGRLLKVNSKEYNDSDLDFWEAGKLTENWFFSEKDKSTLAFIWPSEGKVAFSSWYYIIEHHFKKSGSQRTQPLYMAIDLFHSVKEVREFALRRELESEAVHSSFDLKINDDNPFCSANVSGAFVDYKSSALEAEVKICAVQNPYLCKEEQLTAEDNQHQVNFEFELEGNKPLELITAKADYPTQQIQATKAIFIKRDGLIVVSEEKEGDNTVFAAGNGILQIKAAPEFAPALFSLTYKGREWLDSDFPAKPCKSWWNLWFGGISSYPDSLKEHHRLAEDTTVTFVKRCDSKGNIWEGIRISTKIEQFSALKGVTYNQYYLLQPNLPVLVLYTEVEQKSGFWMQYTNVAGDLFVKPDSDFKSLEMDIYNHKNRTSNKCGQGCVENSYNTNLVSYRCSKNPEILHYYNSNPDSAGEYNIDSFTVSSCFDETKKIKNGETKTFPPKFIVFSECELTPDNLIDLQNIRFEV